MPLRSYLNRLMRCQSIDELWQLHLRQMSCFGFEKLFYGHTRFATPTSLGDPEDFVVLSNHSPEYLEAYLDGGLYAHSPMVQWVMTHRGAALSWAEVAERARLGALTDETARAYDFKLRSGLRAGYTISFDSASERTRAGINLIAAPTLSQGDVEQIWHQHGSDILLMNNVAHMKILTLPFRQPNRRLTPRQLEVLQWVGDGKTTQDIALLMGLTPATVEKHLRLARATLAVETTAQAVLKTAMLNQMYARPESRPCTAQAVQPRS